jgi:hypothetical protein
VAQEKVVDTERTQEGPIDQSTPQGQRELQLGTAGKQLSVDAGKGTSKMEDIEKPGELPGIVPNPNRKKWTGGGKEVEDAEVTTGGDLGKRSGNRREAPDRRESGTSALRGAMEKEEGNPVGTEPAGDQGRKEPGRESDDHLGASLETSPAEVKEREEKKRSGDEMAERPRSNDSGKNDPPLDYSI